MMDCTGWRDKANTGTESREMIPKAASCVLGRQTSSRRDRREASELAHDSIEKPGYDKRKDCGAMNSGEALKRTNRSMRLVGHTTAKPRNAMMQYLLHHVLLIVQNTSHISCNQTVQSQLTLNPSTVHYKVCAVAYAVEGSWSIISDAQHRHTVRFTHPCISLELLTYAEADFLTGEIDNSTSWIHDWRMFPQPLICCTPAASSAMHQRLQAYDLAPSRSTDAMASASGLSNHVNVEEKRLAVTLAIDDLVCADHSRPEKAWWR